MKITKPTLLVDKEKCLENIRRMAIKAKAANAYLRPHFKTHHSAEIGEWFREFGVDKCTASSVEMAGYFAKAGWDDITIAFPYNSLESEDISEIAKTTALNILIESEESLHLANTLIQNPVGYFLKIDIGTHRTGIDPEKLSLIKRLVQSSTDKVKFQGFLGHAGHTYYSPKAEIPSIFTNSVDILNKLKAQFGGVISYGDTPSCSMIDDLSGIDEIRAGNFVFYDWMQKEIGSCDIDDISVCLASPVVAIHEEREEVVVFGGGVHLSKEGLEENGAKCFGKAVRLKTNGWGSQVVGNVRKISQEHGVVQVPAAEISKLKLGDLLGILPIHSCMAADLQGHYFSTGGEKILKIIKD
ncbi:MAG: alanine racemase [Cyclobacteriaceae bacterium]